MNTRIVRRSAALFNAYGEPYGLSFRYQEYLKYRPPLGRIKAGLVTGGLALYEAALDRPRVRALLRKFQPKPGEGPSEKTIKTGWFMCELLGIAEDGRRVRGLIAHTGDPSNHATSEFVAEIRPFACARYRKASWRPSTGRRADAVDGIGRCPCRET